jgi:hypothetical protein
MKTITNNFIFDGGDNNRKVTKKSFNKAKKETTKYVKSIVNKQSKQKKKNKLVT